MRTRLLLIASLLAGCAGESIEAQSRTATLRVSAHVVSDCVVTVRDLLFGDYDPVATNRSQALDATADVTLTCTRGTIAAIDLSDGLYGGQARASGVGTRAMGSGARNFLPYDLYKDAGRRERWGQSASGMAMAAASSTAPRTVVVYGRVPANQDAPVGRYVDEVLVTVRF
jgi:spore coat protein U-like protein